LIERAKNEAMGFMAKVKTDEQKVEAVLEAERERSLE
jgi:hypothetical protein